jgi:hypothetical protein
MEVMLYSAHRRSSMPRKTQTTVLEILLDIAVAMFIITMAIRFFSQNTFGKIMSEEYPCVGESSID